MACYPQQYMGIKMQWGPRQWVQLFFKILLVLVYHLQSKRVFQGRGERPSFSISKVRDYRSPKIVESPCLPDRMEASQLFSVPTIGFLEPLLPRLTLLPLGL
jgi:hypothetical protein